MELFGFYRAEVIDSNDPEQFGRVKIWIPDIMPEVDRNKGLWAAPANTPIGGRNEESTPDNYYYGSTFIPAKGSWVLIFFEAGNINRPYYFASLNLQNTKVLPENQLGSEPYKKWVLLKSGEGRAIVISDDADDARVEITGKKRQISEPPSGDTDSVYNIDNNQTSVLFDERGGKEKILIRTHKGDFFHIDVDEQKLQASFEKGITMTTNGGFYIKAKLISMKSEKNINQESGDSFNIKSGGDLNMESSGTINEKGSSVAIEGSGSASVKAGGVLAFDGSFTSLNEGQSTSAGSASPADESEPKGERDT